LSAVLAVLSLAVMTAAVLTTKAMGQGQGAPNAQNIAVIDVGKILKNDEKFKQEMSALQAEVVATEQELRAQANDLQKLVQQQKGFAPDTPDYRRLDEQITHGQSELNVRKTLKNKELVERQSKMLLGAYREVQDAVKQFSAQYNIGLVIQYDSSPIDGSDPQAILSGAHRQVVFVNPGLDITNDILASLNRSAPRVGNSNGAATQGVGIPH